MQKREISTPMFIKITGVDELSVKKVRAFLDRDEVRSWAPIFAGKEELGRLPYIELQESSLNEEHGTYTLHFKVHPFFWSWRKSPNRAVKKRCPRSLINDFFYLNFNFFENSSLQIAFWRIPQIGRSVTTARVTARIPLRTLAP